MRYFAPERDKALREGMIEALSRGENMTTWALNEFLSPSEIDDPETRSRVVALSYDLQAGSYANSVSQNPDFYLLHWSELAGVLNQWMSSGDSVLEAGVGEASTLAGVLPLLRNTPSVAGGFDFSFSRLFVAQKILKGQGLERKLFMGDLFNIPLAENSVDVVFTSHALEPNGGREREGVRELLRVCRKFLILVEPAYEMANAAARERMRRLNYVSGLEEACFLEGGQVRQYERYAASSESNPAAVIVVEKVQPGNALHQSSRLTHQSPVSQESLTERRQLLFSEKTKEAFPIIEGIPLLLAQYQLSWDPGLE